MILLSISILAIIISFAIYRRRPFELVLRIAAIVLIYLLISNFMLTVPAGARQSVPIVLIDHSKSMVRSLPGIREAASKIKFPHDLFFFSESLLATAEPERLGAYTDIGRAIREAAKMHPPMLLLVTDGNHNFGSSPLTVLDELNTPVYVYGAGEETVRDASIMAIASRVYAFPGDSIEIDVIIESGGFSGGTGQVTFSTASGTKLETQTFHLSDVPARSRISFWQVPREPGTSTFNVNIEPLADEMSYDNNKSTLSFNVLEEKIKVLYYTDHVSFNTKFILEALSLDDNLSVSSMTKQGPGEYRRLHNVNETTMLDITAFDVVILDNVNIGKPPWNNLPALVDKGKGVLLTGSIDDMNEQWRDIVPINTTGGRLEGYSRIQIVEPFSALTGSDFPPPRSVNRVVGSKQDATIIARSNNLPVIGFRQHGRGRIFQICIGDLGPWNFLLRGVKNKDLLNLLIDDIVRFLSPQGSHTRLVLDTKQRDYQVGETVHLKLQSYDRSFRTTGGGDFFLDAGDQRIPFYETQEGIYEADILLQREGKQNIIAEGELDGEILTSNAIDIDVRPRSEEAEHRLNRALLESIAARTNGRILMLEELYQAAPAPPKSELRKETKVISLNTPLVYFSVLIILAVDWILRRRRGIT